MKRLTSERCSGIKSGYWSPAKKDELIQRLGKYEDTGLEPEEIRHPLSVSLEAASSPKGGAKGVSRSLVTDVLLDLRRNIEKAKEMQEDDQNHLQYLREQREDDGQETSIIQQAYEQRIKDRAYYIAKEQYLLDAVRMVKEDLR